jgi:hypothetical protein
MNFLCFFSFSSYFPALRNEIRVILILEFSFVWGPPVNGVEDCTRPARQSPSPTWTPHANHCRSCRGLETAGWPLWLDTAADPKPKSSSFLSVQRSHCHLSSSGYRSQAPPLSSRGASTPSSSRAKLHRHLASRCTVERQLWPRNPSVVYSASAATTLGCSTTPS